MKTIRVEKTATLAQLHDLAQRLRIPDREVVERAIEDLWVRERGTLRPR
jgi:hypothetical protein